MRVIIFGLPKTGTTGLYGLVKNAMIEAGLDPICSFEPPGSAGYLSFLENARPEVAFLSKAMIRKSYFEEENFLPKFSHRVMIVRDPRDRAISRLLFRPLGRRLDDEKALGRFVDALKQKEQSPKSVSFTDLVSLADELGIGKSEWKTVGSRMQYQIDIIKQHDFFAYHYEAFVHGNYYRLANYLGLNFTKAKSENQGWLGHISRSKGSGDWRTWFTEDDVNFLRPIFKPYMDHFGYADDWELVDDPVIDPKNASNYVQSKFEKRKKEFAMMDSEASAKEITENQLQFYRGRAEDGRLPDVIRLAAYYEGKGDKANAIFWYERAHVLGSNKATKMLTKLLGDGVKPKSPISIAAS